MGRGVPFPPDRGRLPPSHREDRLRLGSDRHNAPALRCTEGSPDALMGLERAAGSHESFHPWSGPKVDRVCAGLVQVSGFNE
jgi:hypothetical protein